MKLTLRDLFWLVLVVAMGCGWWVERRVLIARYHEKVSQLLPLPISDLQSVPKWP